MQRKVVTSHQNKPKLFLHETSLNRRKTLKMPENTGFTGNVVANWLQKCVINLLSELYEYVYFECRREICGILCIDFSK